MSAVILILSDARGIYIPRDFITNEFGEIDASHCAAWGLTEEDKEWWQDASNPENEYYWDAWDWILDNAEFVDEEGDKYQLWQDGDLWAICYDKMTEEEKRNFGFDE